MIIDIPKTFQSLRDFIIKLNPKKYVFGVPSEKLLGFLVSQRGIEVNPEKIATIMKMGPPSCLWDAQKLTGAWHC